MRQKFLLVSLGIIILLVLVLPYETTVVPAWTLRVIDENGRPYAHKEVRETWKHYTLEASAADNMDDKYTDEQGYVSFPERRIRSSLIKRAVMTVFNTIMTVAHGSIGISASVAATGPQGYKRIEYDRKLPLPKELVLPSASEE